MSQTMTLLALSGSLRAGSYNTAALEALARLAPAHVTIVVYKGLGDLPLFNPDRETQVLPALAALQDLLQAADGLIIASPEYAHGISGVMKNTLEWLVSGAAFINVPIMLINTSPRASHAQAALREVLTTMSGNIVDAACLAIPLLGSDLDAAAIVAQPLLAEALTESLAIFFTTITELPDQRFGAAT